MKKSKLFSLHVALSSSGCTLALQGEGLGFKYMEGHRILCGCYFVNTLPSQCTQYWPQKKSCFHGAKFGKYVKLLIYFLEKGTTMKPEIRDRNSTATTMQKSEKSFSLRFVFPSITFGFRFYCVIIWNIKVLHEI